MAREAIAGQDVALPQPAVRAPTRYPSAARIALYGSSLLVVTFLVLPSVLVAVMSLGSEKYLEFPPRSLSLRWYEAYFRDPDWIGPTLFSLRVGALSALASTAIGTMASLALVRGRLPAREWINAIVVAPVVAPAIIVAIAVYLLFARWHLVGTTPGFVLAHTVLTVPYVVLTVSAALSRFDPSLELAALSLGASPLKAFLKVTLPLVLPGVLAGGAFAFIVSFDEAVVSFFISGVTTKTLPKKLFEDIDFDVSPTVAAVGTLLTALSLLVVGGIELARSRGGYLRTEPPESQAQADARQAQARSAVPSLRGGSRAAHRADR